MDSDDKEHHFRRPKLSKEKPSLEKAPSSRAFQSSLSAGGSGGWLLACERHHRLHAPRDGMALMSCRRPPWEAFCNQPGSQREMVMPMRRCGLYQEFYQAQERPEMAQRCQVRWDKPFMEADYSKVENGSSDPGGR